MKNIVNLLISKILVFLEKMSNKLDIIVWIVNLNEYLYTLFWMPYIFSKKRLPYFKMNIETHITLFICKYHNSVNRIEIVSM